MTLTPFTLAPFIVLWNSIAKRRRSISDTFYDNGLATIKGYLEEKSKSIEIIDWARDDFFSLLSPPALTKCLRSIYSRILSTENKLTRKTLGLTSMLLQDILSALQEKRLKKHLRKLARELKNKNVRIFGVKIWYGEAFKNAKYLVGEIKKIAPQVITIAGGYHVSLYEEHLLENSNFDLAVACEGEFAIDEILNVACVYKDNWNKEKILDEIIKQAEEGKIENLLYRKAGKIYKTARRQITVHSSKSIPRYSLSENKVSIHVMVESLGCDWGHCNFCVHPQFYPHYSLRDPEEITREIEEMLKNGIRIFRFAGSDTPPSFGAKIAQKIKEKNLKIIFGMGSRPIKGAKNQFDNLVGSYTALIESGLRAVFMGGESGNNFINREVMNKGVEFEDIVYTIKALREAQKKTGEQAYLSLALIYPMPLLGKVTLSEVKEDNIRLLREAVPDSVMITPPGPFLHTKWYEERDKFGFTVDPEIIKQAMEYEYVLYKPPDFWPHLGISLEGKPFKKLLDQCNELRMLVEKTLQIPTDISDEHFLMFYSAGIRSKEDILNAKKETMLDIISCNYNTIRNISSKVNEFSRALGSKGN